MAAEDYLNLNMALEAVLTAEKGIDIKVEGASKKLVRYRVTSEDREASKSNVESFLTQYNVYKGKLNSSKIVPGSGMAGTECMMVDDTVLRFTYKPKRGGMSQTTLNSSITELFPCVAFETKISPSLTNEKFWEQIKLANHSGLVCYLDPKDAKAGTDFIKNADEGKFEEKVGNARDILKWILAVHKKHPISDVYWGYRKKPPNVASNHPGDIFLRFKSSGNLLGISLKAGSATSAEPKLNTYVKPIFDFYGREQDYRAIKEELWPNYMKITGVEESDKSKWDTNALALKTFEYEKTNETEYNEIYDANLIIIKNAIVRLMNSYPAKTKQFISEKLALHNIEPPVVVVKANGANARRDKSNALLIQALTAADKFEASIPSGKGKGGKQAFNVLVADGIHLNLDFTTRTNKVGARHKLGQFTNLAVKFNKVTKLKG